MLFKEIMNIVTQAYYKEFEVLPDRYTLSVVSHGIYYEPVSLMPDYVRKFVAEQASKDRAVPCETMEEMIKLHKLGN